MSPPLTSVHARNTAKLVGWIRELLQEEVWSTSAGAFVTSDPDLIFPVASILDRYFEVHEWSNDDAQLVGVSAYRLVVCYVESVVFTNADIAGLCDNAFTATQAREYMFKVWQTCGRDRDDAYNVHHHVLEYRAMLEAA
eukprot:jgi/Tetstr1/454268/TSEL_041187.t1